MIEPEIGKTYVLNHKRKGRFALRVTQVSEEWIGGEVVEGEVKYLARPYGEPGETVTVRRSFLLALEELGATPLPGLEDL